VQVISGHVWSWMEGRRRGVSQRRKAQRKNPRHNAHSGAAALPRSGSSSPALRQVKQHPQHKKLGGSRRGPPAQGGILNMSAHFYVNCDGGCACSSPAHAPYPCSSFLVPSTRFCTSHVQASRHPPEPQLKSVLHYARKP